MQAHTRKRKVFIFPNKRADSFINVAKLGVENFNFTPPVLTPDLFVNSVPKRSISDVENQKNTTESYNRSKDGFVVKFVPVNESHLAVDDVDKEDQEYA